MKRIAFLADPWWRRGLVLAAAGIVLTRAAAPALADPGRSVVALAGELVALGGLTAIAIGIRRRGLRKTPSS